MRRQIPPPVPPDDPGSPDPSPPSDLPLLPAAIRVEEDERHRAWFWSNPDVPGDRAVLGICGGVTFFFLGGAIWAFARAGLGSTTGPALLVGLVLLGVFGAIGGFCLGVLLRSLGAEFLYVDPERVAWGWRVLGFERRNTVPIDRVDELFCGRARDGQGDPEAYPTLNLYHRPVGSLARKRKMLAPTVHPAVKARLAAHLGAAFRRWRPGIAVAIGR